MNNHNSVDELEKKDYERVRLLFHIEYGVKKELKAKAKRDGFSVGLILRRLARAYIENRINMEIMRSNPYGQKRWTDVL